MNNEFKKVTVEVYGYVDQVDAALKAIEEVGFDNDVTVKIISKYQEQSTAAFDSNICFPID